MNGVALVPEVGDMPSGPCSDPAAEAAGVDRKGRTAAQVARARSAVRTRFRVCIMESFFLCSLVLNDGG